MKLWQQTSGSLRSIQEWWQLNSTLVGGRGHGHQKKDEVLEALKLWPQTTTLHPLTLHIRPPLSDTLTPHPLTLHIRSPLSHTLHIRPPLSHTPSHPAHSPSTYAPPLSHTPPTHPPHTVPLLDVPSHADCALCCQTTHGSIGHEPSHYKSPYNWNEKHIINWGLENHRNILFFFLQKSRDGISLTNL